MTYTQSFWQDGDDDDDDNTQSTNNQEQHEDPGDYSHSDDLMGKVDKDNTSEQAL